MSISPEELRHLARLARLDVSDAEAEQLRDDLTRILAYVAQLDACHTDDAEPMTHVLDLHNVTRPDAPQTRLSRDAALDNAPDTDGTHFRVPKVIG